MNPSDWRKAVALVTQHKQEAAMAETEQLSSMPLSQIAIDDNDPPVVHYGSHMPVAASTPTGTIPHLHSSQQEDSYQEIIPGIPQGSLYPTLSSLSSGFVASDTNAQSPKVTKGLDQYLQDAELSVLQKLTILMILSDLQIHQMQDKDKQDTIVHDADVLHDDDDYTAIDTIADGTSI